MNAPNSPMVFFNIGWMKRYRGLTADDTPQGGGKFVQDYEWDRRMKAPTVKASARRGHHSMLNFLAFKGHCHGGWTGSGEVDLGRLGAAPDADHLDGMTVVWVSSSPIGGTVIVGWYRNAALFRHGQEPPEGSGRVDEGNPIRYYAIANVDECHLLPEESRIFKVPRGKSRMGQSNVWYADQPEDEPFKKQVSEYINSLGKTIPSLEARTWIFQANPKLFNIDETLTKLAEIRWTIKAYKDDIHTGDHVFVWRSGEDAGIVAEGTVLTLPTVMDETEQAVQFAVEPEKFSGPQLRVRLRIDDLVTPPLPRDLLKSDVRLTELSILRNAQGTNFAVTHEQASVIHELLENQQNDEDEVPARGVIDPKSGSRVWTYAPGPKAQFWEEFYREEIMAIGWDELGDLQQYPDHDALAKKLMEAYELNGYPINDSRACYDFLSTMRPGDRVIVKRGRNEAVGYGIVTGDYEYRPARTHYRNVRQVRWERRGNWKCEPVFAVKTLTDLSSDQDTVRYLTELIGVSEALPVPLAPTLPSYTIDEALKEVAFDRGGFAGILDLWQVKKNVILQGPPGVGKTFLARRLAYSLIGYEMPSRVAMIQFHQSYSYEDFIQGYRPAENGFARTDGVFVRFCKRASLDQDSKYIFIIDEINRSNLSKVFGELLMLIEADKRGSKNSLALTYATSDEEQFYVPPNVYILGLMNTADRSLAIVDYALRRRFAFVELKPLFGSSGLRDFLVNSGSGSKLVAAISARLQNLNQAIADDQNLGPGFMIGHSYFCGSALTEKGYMNTIRHEILPLLKEYWFDDPDRVNQWTEKLEANLDQA